MGLDSERPQSHAWTTDGWSPSTQENESSVGDRHHRDHSTLENRAGPWHRQKGLAGVQARSRPVAPLTGTCLLDWADGLPLIPTPAPLRLRRSMAQVRAGPTGPGRGSRWLWLLSRAPKLRAGLASPHPPDRRCRRWRGTLAPWHCEERLQWLVSDSAARQVATTSCVRAGDLAGGIQTQ